MAGGRRGGTTPCFGLARRGPKCLTEEAQSAKIGSLSRHGDAGHRDLPDPPGRARIRRGPRPRERPRGGRGGLRPRPGGLVPGPPRARGRRQRARAGTADVAAPARVRTLPRALHLPAGPGPGSLLPPPSAGRRAARRRTRSSSTDRDMVVAYYKGDRLDLGEVVREQCFLSLPLKRLCREDCRGRCPTCGAQPEHGDLRMPDPGGDGRRPPRQPQEALRRRTRSPTMPNPKRRHSKARRDKRRAHDHLQRAGPEPLPAAATSRSCRTASARAAATTRASR